MSEVKIIKINSMQELLTAIQDYNVPTEIVSDVDKRITDWLASGGKEDDDYIRQQYRFIERFVYLYR